MMPLQIAPRKLGLIPSTVPALMFESAWPRCSLPVLAHMMMITARTAITRYIM